MTKNKVPRYLLIVKGSPLPDRQSRLRERGGGEPIEQVDGPQEEGRHLLC